jgi:hypothetical protein
MALSLTQWQHRFFSNTASDEPFCSSSFVLQIASLVLRNVIDADRNKKIEMDQSN